ncbi:MAG: YbhB/YbcL family Raf kinase inhibitor-like protein, partial [Acidimicrobiales bacterium]|nr:YbhB/YbcL family Raf kinase inhibitor-like protein [Acidimicrobiales bacterium]
VLTAFAPMGACSNDGRTLAPVDPDYTTTSGTPVIDAGPEVSSAGSFRLASEGFAAGAELPAQFTCAGAGVSPSLAWSEAPGGAELAVVMRERDSVASVHWIVTGMDPALLGFGDGGVPEGAELQVNAAGETAYLPPCPPAGSGTHLYDIVLHVLDEPLSFDPALRAPDLAATIETASRAEAPLTATVNA